MRGSALRGRPPPSSEILMLKGTGGPKGQDVNLGALARSRIWATHVMSSLPSTTMTFIGGYSPL
jgi:hypothetical protein